MAAERRRGAPFLLAPAALVAAVFADVAARLVGAPLGFTVRSATDAPAAALRSDSIAFSASARRL